MKPAHLAWNSEFFRNLIDELHDPIYIICPADKFRFHYVNSATCVHYGLSEAQLLQMSIPDWDPNFTFPICDGFWAQVKNEKQVTISTLHRIGNGDVVPVEVTASYLQFGTQEYIGGFIRNVTARKKADEKIKNLAESLARSNEELKHFAHVASHDLREPLRTVASYVSLIERNYAELLDADGRDFVRFSVDGITRMNRLIDSLLDYSKIEHTNPKIQTVDCMKVMGQVRENLKVVIQEAEADLQVCCLPSVRGDEVQLGQLFQNLVSNALKFRGKRRPKIVISARERNDTLLFSVEDNGIGIDIKHQERVFQLFQRLHSQDEYAGAGLGLAICKKIVHRLGGNIWFDSTPGEKTTFFFTLPKA